MEIKKKEKHNNYLEGKIILDEKGENKGQQIEREIILYYNEESNVYKGIIVFHASDPLPPNMNNRVYFYCSKNRDKNPEEFNKSFQEAKEVLQKMMEGEKETIEKLKQKAQERQKQLKRENK